MSLETNNNQNSSFSQTPLKEVGLFFWDLLKILAVALAIVIPFRLLVAEPFVVSGSSMLPNYHNNDYLIIDRITYLRQQPQRGDVVVLKFPKDTSQFFIKRIIGLPGEKIQIRQGHVVIYNSEHPEGKILEESYLPSQVETLGRTEPVQLGSAEYFVLGDNRQFSLDSRYFGPIYDFQINGVEVFRTSNESLSNIIFNAIN